LAAQIRQSTTATKSAAADAWRAALHKTNELQLANDHSMEVWHRGAFMREELSGQDLSTCRTLISAALSAIEKLYLEHQKGNVDDATWKAARNTLRWVLFSPSGHATWKEWTDWGLADERFAEYTNALMQAEYESEEDSATREPSR
jgi:hypothetical protein